MFAQMDNSKSWLASYRFTQRPIEARAQDRFTFGMKPVNPDRLLFKVRGGEFSEATKALMPGTPTPGLPRPVLC